MTTSLASLKKIAKNYSSLNDKEKTAFITGLVEHNYSIAAIAELCGTYANRIRRDGKKLGCKLPNKSMAQKAALASGRKKHPTEGSKRNPDTILKISNGVARSWSSHSNEELKNRAQKSKESWEARSDDNKQAMLQKARQKLRETATNGSKFEKFIQEQLLTEGFHVEWHVRRLVQNEQLEVDLFLPELNTVIEIDGPSHFLPIWGEEALKKSRKADENKNGLLLNAGFCVVRVKQTKELSDKYKRDIWDKLRLVVWDIHKKFPVKNNRFFELEI